MSVHGNSDPWSLVKSLRRQDSRSKAASAAGGAAVGERCLHAMHGGAGDLLHKVGRICSFLPYQQAKQGVIYKWRPAFCAPAPHRPASRNVAAGG